MFQVLSSSLGALLLSLVFKHSLVSFYFIVAVRRRSNIEVLIIHGMEFHYFSNKSSMGGNIIVMLIIRRQRNLKLIFHMKQNVLITVGCNILRGLFSDPSHYRR